MRSSDWSSDVDSSDLHEAARRRAAGVHVAGVAVIAAAAMVAVRALVALVAMVPMRALVPLVDTIDRRRVVSPGARTVELGRAHVCTPVTNAHLVCRLMLEQKTSSITHHKRL